MVLMFAGSIAASSISNGLSETREQKACEPNNDRNAPGISRRWYGLSRVMPEIRRVNGSHAVLYRVVR